MRNPLVRSDDVVVQDLDGEIMVFDARTQQYHALNAPTAAVWRRADGTRGADDLARELAGDPALALTDATAPDAVMLALGELAAAGLLERGAGMGIDRRAAVRRLAAAGLVGVAVPAIASLVAPTPAMAQSGGSTGGRLVTVPASLVSSEGAPNEALAIESVTLNLKFYAQNIAASAHGTYVSHTWVMDRVRYDPTYGEWVASGHLTSVTYRL